MTRRISPAFSAPIVGLALYAVVSGTSCTNAPSLQTASPTASSTPALPMSVTAQHLGEAYSLIGGNPAQADKEYENKNLTVTGVTELVFSDGTGRMSFKTGGNAIGVMCWFKGEGANVLHVQEGQSVVVNGQCQGMNGAEVVLDECTLQNAPSRASRRSHSLGAALMPISTTAWSTKSGSTRDGLIGCPRSSGTPTSTGKPSRWAGEVKHEN